MHIHHVILITLAALIIPQRATAIDPFSTEDGIEHGRLDQAADMGHCTKEKILSPLSLAEVVDLALCNNPQTHTL